MTKQGAHSATIRRPSDLGGAQDLACRENAKNSGETSMAQGGKELGMSLENLGYKVSHVGVAVVPHRFDRSVRVSTRECVHDAGMFRE